MKRLFVLAFLMIGSAVLLITPSASALGLKVAPLEYKTTLKQGDKQQGFIDISNPSTQAMAVRVSVQAFRQIDNEGGLQFYDDERIAAGIRPELRDIEMGPREATRLFFDLDGEKLPEGDLFAAIFFTTEPKQARNGVGQLVRVGTLLSIVNKTPGQRSAVITKLDVPFVQLDATINGSYQIRNTAREGTGFYPTVKVSSWPGDSEKQIQGSLVFNGRQRTNDFSYQLGYGLHRIEVSYGDSKKQQWVVSVAPWMVALTALILLVFVIELLLLKRRRKAKAAASSKASSTS